jgi:hypothetical protein
MNLSSDLIQRAISPSPWDLGNQVLYDLCSSYPLHTSVPQVIAKVWLIGRAYAAAIERRRNKTDENDDFYVNKVGPGLCASGIDSWLKSLRVPVESTAISLLPTLRVHANVTALFRQISGLEKRSLASKYLHFHAPSHFYIYDARAVLAMQKLRSIVGRTAASDIGADNEYRKFAQKCQRLQQSVLERHSVALTPRQVDNLLLALYAET